MGRISRECMFMEMARIASKRSTCHRLNVGALVVKDNNPISIGWNGQSPGAPHCPGNFCPGILPGNCNTIHAEVNALRKAEELLSGEILKVDLYITHSPCRDCCNYIKKSRLWVNRIFFEIPYRNTDHLSKDLDMGIYEITPAGYVIDHFSRQVVEIP